MKKIILSLLLIASSIESKINVPGFTDAGAGFNGTVRGCAAAGISACDAAACTENNCLQNYQSAMSTLSQTQSDACGANTSLQTAEANWKAFQGQFIGFTYLLKNLNSLPLSSGAPMTVGSLSSVPVNAEENIFNIVYYVLQAVRYNQFSDALVKNNSLKFYFMKSSSGTVSMPAVGPYYIMYDLLNEINNYDLYTLNGQNKYGSLNSSITAGFKVNYPTSQSTGSVKNSWTSFTNQPSFYSYGPIVNSLKTQVANCKINSSPTGQVVSSPTLGSTLTSGTAPTSGTLAGLLSSVGSNTLLNTGSAGSSSSSTTNSSASTDSCPIFLNGDKITSYKQLIHAIAKDSGVQTWAHEFAKQMGETAGAYYAEQEKYFNGIKKMCDAYAGDNKSPVKCPSTFPKYVTSGTQAYTVPFLSSPTYVKGGNRYVQDGTLYVEGGGTLSFDGVLQTFNISNDSSGAETYIPISGSFAYDMLQVPVITDNKGESWSYCDYSAGSINQQCIWQTGLYAPNSGIHPQILGACAAGNPSPNFKEALCAYNAATNPKPYTQTGCNASQGALNALAFGVYGAAGFGAAIVAYQALNWLSERFYVNDALRSARDYIGDHLTPKGRAELKRKSLEDREKRTKEIKEEQERWAEENAKNRERYERRNAEREKDRAKEAERDQKNKQEEAEELKEEAENDPGQGAQEELKNAEEDAAKAKEEGEKADAAEATAQEENVEAETDAAEEEVDAAEAGADEGGAE